MYFDGSPSDPSQYHQAVEISSSSAGSSHTSYLKQLEDYLLEKEMDIDEQMNQDKNERLKGRAPPSSSRPSTTRQQPSTKKPIAAEYSSYTKDKSSTINNRGTKQSINVTSSLEKIGEMTLEELAQLPLDLSDSSHLDIIDSEINAFYKNAYDQPRKANSSNRKTTSSTRSRTVVEPSISLPSRKPPQPQKPKEVVKPKMEVEEEEPDLQPQEESEPFSQSESQPSNLPHPELTQAKSSLSLLKSKIKQVSRSARKTNLETSNTGLEGNDTECTNGSTPVSREEEEENCKTPARNETDTPSRSNFRVPVPVGLKATGRTSHPSHTFDSGDDGIDENYSRIRGGRTDIPRSAVHSDIEEDSAPQNKKQPQSLQDILRQKIQPPANIRSSPLIDNSGTMRPKESQRPAQDDDHEYDQSRQKNRGSKEVTSSYSSNPYDQDDFEVEEGDEGEVPTEECPDCGRKFIPTAFAKHVKICAKVFMQKRKKFDSTKQRLQGEGVDPELKKVYEKSKKEDLKMKRSGGKAQNSGQSESKWKQQSSAFRDAMKAAREYTKAKERGEEPPPPMISAPDPSLIPCPHCGRRFNEMAANRHIPQCSNIKAKPTSLKRGGGITAAAGAVKPRKY